MCRSALPEPRVQPPPDGFEEDEGPPKPAKLGRSAAQAESAAFTFGFEVFSAFALGDPLAAKNPPLGSVTPCRSRQLR